MRAERNYKIGIECEIDEESSEMVQRSISSVPFHDSMKHYRAAQNFFNLIAGLEALTTTGASFDNTPV